MSNPFPGVDPFIECQEWQDFLTTFNTVIREVLTTQVEPEYVVRVERRVYLERDDSQRSPDVVVLFEGSSIRTSTAVYGEAAISVMPATALIPMPEERRESYLIVRDRQTLEVVTVIETLSPSNKRKNSVGRREYLQKRDIMLESHSHLVELDLLLAGDRLPMDSQLPAGEFYVITSRSESRPHAEVYAWSLPQALPAIMIPLKTGDPDVRLDLQTVYSTVCNRARYDLSLDYKKPLSVALSESDTAWLNSILNPIQN